MTPFSWHQAALCFGSAVLGAAFYGGMIHAQGDVYRAKKYILINEENEQIGELGGDANGAHLDLYGPYSDQGKQGPSLKDHGGIIHLTAGAEVANIGLMGKDHQALDLFTGDVFCGTLTVRDADSKERFQLSASGKGMPGLTLVDKDDNKIEAFRGLKPPQAQPKEKKR